MWSGLNVFSCPFPHEAAPRQSPLPGADGDWSRRCLPHTAVSHPALHSGSAIPSPGAPVSVKPMCAGCQAENKCGEVVCVPVVPSLAPLELCPSLADFPLSLPAVLTTGIPPASDRVFQVLGKKHGQVQCGQMASHRRGLFERRGEQGPSPCALCLIQGWGLDWGSEMNSAERPQPCLPAPAVLGSPWYACYSQLFAIIER